VDSISAEKRLLRADLRQSREDNFIAESWIHIVQSPEIQEAQIIGSYISYGFEPQTLDINTSLIESGKTLLLPRTLPNKDLEWVAWDGSPTSLNKNGKVLEPEGRIFGSESSIDVVIVPALVVDRQGNRMGQGGGSYDRALARISSWKLALVGAHEILSTSLPTENHDVKVDAVATPGLLLRFNQDAPGRP
jgi:5-formyltetrahydrofolate cyclo-ligase